MQLEKVRSGKGAAFHAGRYSIFSHYRLYDPDALGPQLMEAFSILSAQFALLVSTYTISAGVSGFIGAFFIDRFDRRKALVAMASGFTIGTLLCSFLQPTSYCCYQDPLPVYSVVFWVL